MLEISLVMFAQRDGKQLLAFKEKGSVDIFVVNTYNTKLEILVAFNSLLERLNKDVFQIMHIGSEGAVIQGRVGVMHKLYSPI